MDYRRIDRMLPNNGSVHPVEPNASTWEDTRPILPSTLPVPWVVGWKLPEQVVLVRDKRSTIYDIIAAWYHILYVGVHILWTGLLNRSQFILSAVCPSHQLACSFFCFVFFFVRFFCVSNTTRVLSLVFNDHSIILRPIIGPLKLIFHSLWH